LHLFLSIRVHISVLYIRFSLNIYALFGDLFVSQYSLYNLIQIRTTLYTSIH
jgi:hypothetical protein